MIHLSFGSHSSGQVRLGEILVVTIIKEEPSLEVRLLLQHHSILYPSPVTPWTREPEIPIFPESPGPYRITAEWRSPVGGRGRESIDFEVEYGAGGAPLPHLVSIDQKERLWTPGEWEAKTFCGAEKDTLGLLEKWVEKGDMVFDIGANIGIYSLALARLVGPTGHVYCLEANPVCVHYLQANLLANKVRNATVIPAALLDVEGEARFNINYGNSNLGLVEQSRFFGDKLGHSIRVPSYRLDDLVEVLSLPVPQVIKIDVEGVEHLVISGMIELLRESSPKLFLELHGEECARDTISQLELLGYLFFDPSREVQEPESPVTLYQRYPGGTVFRVLATPR